jgi:hypothetical protein
MKAGGGEDAATARGHRSGTNAAHRRPCAKHHAKNTSLYVLILASRHPKGEEFWAKVTTQEPSGQRRLALEG